MKDNFLPDSKCSRCSTSAVTGSYHALVIISVVMFGPTLASFLATSMLREDDRVKSGLGRGLGPGRGVKKMLKPPEENPSHGTGQNWTVESPQETIQDWSRGRGRICGQIQGQRHEELIWKERGSQVQLHSHRRRDGLREKPRNRVPCG